MLSALLPPTLLGALGFVVLIGGTTMTFLLMLPFALLRWIAPTRGMRNACVELVHAVTWRWAVFNRFAYHLFWPVAWDIEVHGETEPGRSYLLISNHQSWIDILLMVHVLYGRAPFPRFFVKRELLWVPVVGWGCWVLDMPSMRRYPKEALARDPALRDEDRAATRRACERFREHPVTLVNFVEGTRCTEAKRVARRSPYRHLLRPKAAGVAYALDAMGDQFAGIIDLTIAYCPSRHPVVWSFLTGEQNHLAVRADVIPLPQELLHGDYQGDPAFRARFQDWINALWAKKDARLDRFLSGFEATVRPRQA